MGVVWCWVMLLVPCNNRCGLVMWGASWYINSHEHSAVLYGTELADSRIIL